MNLLKAPFGEAVLLHKVHSVGGLAVGTASQVFIALMRRSVMKYYTTTTEYNCGIGLQARLICACVMDRQGRDRTESLLSPHGCLVGRPVYRI